jgi:hypothetical protein
MEVWLPALVSCDKPRHAWLSCGQQRDALVSCQLCKLNRLLLAAHHSYAASECHLARLRAPHFVHVID